MLKRLQMQLKGVAYERAQISDHKVTNLWFFYWATVCGFDKKKLLKLINVSVVWKSTPENKYL